jgi:hypothetical protein
MEAQHTPWLHCSLEPLPKSEPLSRRLPGMRRERELIEQRQTELMQNGSKLLLDRVEAFLRYAGQLSPSAGANVDKTEQKASALWSLKSGQTLHLALGGWRRAVGQAHNSQLE